MYLILLKIFNIIINYMFTVGYNSNTFKTNNLGSNLNINTVNKQDRFLKENIILNKTNNNNNFQAFIESDKDDEDMKGTVEYEVINKPRLDDMLKGNVVNKMYLGGITILGLFVLYQFVKRQP
tara:strand:+ start:232 stop:600 length:369 start_codon:yes stop_codon:yes gene_type:complete